MNIQRRTPGRGLFITFEGVEGTGKSTHARRLVERLKQETQTDVLLTREPGGTPLGEALRSLVLESSEVPTPRAELLMMLAARAQHVAQVLVPALNRGSVVVCDRFSDASLAYQSGGRGLEFESVRSADEVATAGLIPDITILLEATPEECAARLRRRAAGKSNRMDQESGDFYQAVSDVYRSLADAHPQRIHRVRTGGDASDAAETVWSVVSPRLQHVSLSGQP